MAMLNRLRWWAKQRAAGKSRFYGDGGTIHDAAGLDVEVHNGRVVSVWFRCQALPFVQTEVNAERAREMGTMAAGVKITGVEVLDPRQVKAQAKARRRKRDQDLTDAYNRAHPDEPDVTIPRYPL